MGLHKQALRASSLHKRAERAAAFRLRVREEGLLFLMTHPIYYSLYAMMVRRHASAYAFSCCVKPGSVVESAISSSSSHLPVMARCAGVYSFATTVNIDTFLACIVAKEDSISLFISRFLWPQTYPAVCF